LILDYHYSLLVNSEFPEYHYSLLVNSEFPEYHYSLIVSFDDVIMLFKAIIHER